MSEQPVSPSERLARKMGIPPLMTPGIVGSGKEPRTMAQHAKIGLVGILALIVLIVALWGKNEDQLAAGGLQQESTGAQDALDAGDDTLSGSMGRDFAIDRRSPEVALPQPEPMSGPTGTAPTGPPTSTGPVVSQVDERTQAPPPPLSTPVGRESSAQVASTPGSGQDYAVSANDSYYTIAKHFYGNGNLWKHIFEANKDRFPNPNVVPLGATIRIPPPPGGQVSPAAVVASRTNTATVPTPQPRQPGTSQRMHTVDHGDTLTAISRKYYGTGDKWRAIYEANQSRLDSPNAIRVGMTLVIPR